MGGDCSKCGARRIDMQLGLEPTPDDYVQNMLAVFLEVRRVLRDDGVCWVNLGDSYSGAGYSNHENTGGAQKEEGGKQRHSNKTGLKPKNLVGIPWHVAFALQADGWWLRQDIIWAKPNPMPESVTDRCTKAHEYIFMLTKSARYYYDAEAVREPVKPDPRDRLWGKTKTTSRHDHQHDKERGMMQTRTQADGFVRMSNPNGRNLRSVWTVTTQPYPDAHFATFPEEIPKRCILASTRPGDVVFDPFAGSGTTVAVAEKLGRRGVGLELKPEYITMAQRRCQVTLGLPL